MCQLRNQNLLVLFSILFLINESSGLKCWRCTSHSTELCGETVEYSKFTEQQKAWYYVECGANRRTENFTPKCRTLKQLVNGLEIYTRSCYYEPENVESNACVEQGSPFIKTLACRTCDKDGCNDKLLNESEVKDNINEKMTGSTNAAVQSVFSYTVLLVLMLIVIIGC